MPAILIGISVSALLLWLALRAVEPAAIAAALRDTNWVFGLPFLFFNALFCFLKAARWRFLLRGVSPTRGSALIEPIVLGYAASTLLPLQLGEVVRGAFAAQRLGVPSAAVFVSIGIERLIDLVALLVLFGVSVLSAPKTSEYLRGGAIAVAVVVFVSVALLLIVIFSRRARAWFQGAALFNAPQRLHAWVKRQLGAVDDGLAWVRQPSNYLPVVLLTALQWLCMLCCVLLTLKATGIANGVAASVSVLVCVLLGMLLPAGPGYIGTLQVAFVVALHAFNVPPADAIAASVFYQVMYSLPLVLAGMLVVVMRAARRPSGVLP